MTKGPRAVAIAATLTLVAAMASRADDAPEEFHRIKQPGGRYLITNLPPAALRADGSIRPHYDPNAAPAQHARMREGLHAHAAALAARRRDQAPGAGPTAQRDPPRPAQPAEGPMSLQRLIELEKRSGRYRAPAPGR
ncbi:MAG: hypothetical protein HKO62_02685 [Gammaproteobacteria bacterium]|nr:hypothetical protein [Gammaproteobacteria bacterium]